MNLLSTLLLATFSLVAVGDRQYDPEVVVDVTPTRNHHTVCLATTGWWTTTEVLRDPQTGEVYRGSAERDVLVIHAILAVIDFDLDGYYDRDVPLPVDVHECVEWERDLSFLNVCIDFRDRPELLRRVCR